MKKIILLPAMVALLASLFTLSSCSKEDVVVIQNMSDIEQCLTYNSFQSTHEYVYAFTKSDVEAAFAAAGVSFDVNKIKNAKVSQLKAEVTTTAATFNDLEGFEVYLRKPGATPDQEIQVAYISNIANNATEITMNINGTDLTTLLAENQLELVLRVTNRDGSGSPVCIKLKEGLLEYKVAAE